MFIENSLMSSFLVVLRKSNAISRDFLDRHGKFNLNKIKEVLNVK